MICIYFDRKKFSSSDLSLYIGWKKWVAECIVGPSTQKFNAIVAQWNKKHI